MTNREYLKSLSNKELAEWLTETYENLKYSFSDTKKRNGGVVE